MLRLLTFLFLLSVSSKQCPKWTCSNYVPDSLCYKLDKKNNSVHVQDSNTEGCAIEPFLRDPEKYKELTYTMVNKSENQTFEVLKRQYCEGVDFYNGVFNCDNFTHLSMREIDYEQKWIKYFINFFHNFTVEGKSEWQACNQDKECLSGKCDCVPSIEGKARCTSSVKDNQLTWLQIFREVCESKTFSDTACKNWLNILFGHHIKAFKENQEFKNLSCLNNFTDVQYLYKGEEQNFWDIIWQKQYQPLTILTLILCCFVFLAGFLSIKYFVKTKSKEDADYDYQELNENVQNTEPRQVQLS